MDTEPRGSRWKRHCAIGCVCTVVVLSLPIVHLALGKHLLKRHVLEARAWTPSERAILEETDYPFESLRVLWQQRGGTRIYELRRYIVCYSGHETSDVGGGCKIDRYWFNFLVWPVAEVHIVYDSSGLVTDVTGDP